MIGFAGVKVVFERCCLGCDYPKLTNASLSRQNSREKPVETREGLWPLEESRFILQRAGPLYFVNEAGVPDSIFLSAGLRKLCRLLSVFLDDANG